MIWEAFCGKNESESSSLDIKNVKNLRKGERLRDKKRVRENKR